MPDDRFLNIKRATLLGALSVAALVSTGAQAAEPIIDPDLLGILPADPKESCLVAGTITGIARGRMEDTTLRTTGGKYDSPGSTTFAHGDTFAFVSVPKGPFRVSKILYRRQTGHNVPWSSLPIPEVKTTLFRAPKEIGIANQYGSLPVEVSGTCAGGFVWLGAMSSPS